MKRLIAFVLVLCLIVAGTPPYHVYLPFVAKGIDMAISYSIITADNVTVNLTGAGINVNPGIPDGFGLPPISHVAKTVYGLPGGVLDSININARVVTLTCSVTAASQEALHAVRKALWAPLRWNRTSVNPPQPARLRYTANSKSVDLYVHYLADVTGNAGDADNLQLVGIRLIAYDPIWYDDAAVNVGLAMTQSITVYFVAQKTTAGWDDMAAGVYNIDNIISTLAVAPDGTLYAGGDLHTPGMHVAKWNGTAWSALGAGLDNVVAALAVAPDGTLYAGGSFHNAGGAAALHVAKWNGTAWSALGAGLDGVVTSLVFAPDGSLYAGGYFTNVAGGGIAVAYIAKWNGAAWSALGAGLDNTVLSLAIAPDNALYVGGPFTTAGGISAIGIAKWSGSAWSALGSGLNNSVNVLAVAPDGNLYAGGAFTNAGNRIAKWNGVSWFALGTGMDDVVYALAFASDGTLYAGGIFTSAGGVTLSDSVAVWNGTAWNQLDIDLPGATSVRAIAVFTTNLYLGFNTYGLSSVSGVTSITNSGTFDARPVFTVTGPGTLSWIENVTTGKKMIFNCYLNAGETATITPKIATFTSDWRGDLLPYAVLLPQSDFGDFALAPAPIAPAGINSIAVMMTGTTPVVQNDNAGTAGAAQLDGWENITGVNCTNTASGGRLYVHIIYIFGHYQIELYTIPTVDFVYMVGYTDPFDPGATGVKTMKPINDSGIGGTITVLETNAADADIIAFFATVCESHYDAYLAADDGV